MNELCREPPLMMVAPEDRLTAFMKAIGPYALKRELSVCASFWTVGGTGGAKTGAADGSAPESTKSDARKHDLLGGSRVAMNAIRAVLGLHDRTESKKDRKKVKSAAKMARVPDRFLALHIEDHSSHVAYRFGPIATALRPSVEAAVRSAALMTFAHILPIEYFTFDESGHLWIFTPYTGDVDGLRTLGRLLREKRGQMSPSEAERAVIQLLEALESAHAVAGAGTPALGLHGAINLEHVLVDRHGSLLIELYGLARSLQAIDTSASSPGPYPISGEHRRDEVRSIVEIGYQLITGLRAEEPLIPAGRLVQRLDPRWDAWFARGLDPSQGFDSAREAMADLPSQIVESVSAPRPLVRVRNVFARFRGMRN